MIGFASHYQILTGRFNSSFPVAEDNYTYNTIFFNVKIKMQIKIVFFKNLIYLGGKNEFCI